jgi:hypothetical protein
MKNINSEDAIKNKHSPQQKEQIVMLTILTEQLNYLILSMGFKYQLMPQHFDFIENEDNKHKTYP